MTMTKKGEGTQATQEVKETKTFETLQDYKDAGYTVGDMVGMSNPPTYFLTSPPLFKKSTVSPPLYDSIFGIRLG